MAHPENVYCRKWWKVKITTIDKFGEDAFLGHKDIEMKVTEEMYRDELEHDANELKYNFHTTETSRKRTKRPARKNQRCGNSRWGTKR